MPENQTNVLLTTSGARTIYAAFNTYRKEFEAVTQRAKFRLENFQSPRVMKMKCPQNPGFMMIKFLFLSQRLH